MDSEEPKRKNAYHVLQKRPKEDAGPVGVEEEKRPA